MANYGNIYISSMILSMEITIFGHKPFVLQSGNCLCPKNTQLSKVVSVNQAGPDWTANFYSNKKRFEIVTVTFVGGIYKIKNKEISKWQRFDQSKCLCPIIEALIFQTKQFLKVQIQEHLQRKRHLFSHLSIAFYFKGSINHLSM